MIRAAFTAFLLALIFAAPASASDAAREATARNLAAGTLAAGDAELSALVARDGKDQDARFGLAIIRFVDAVENLSAGFYRYGARATNGGFPLMAFFMPVPGNPNPQPITYQDFRRLLQAFVDDLAKADATLATVDDPAVKVPIDLMKIAVDVDGDGKISAVEARLVALFIRMGGPRGTQAVDADATVAFDLGDALWLRGYTHVLMATGEFLLAHDWHEAFDGTFTQFFARVVSPMAQATAAPDGPSLLGVSGQSFADAIAFIHLIRWPVAEPQRMRAVRDHLKTAIDLSRRTWTAIEAETDNDREWLPSPRQTSAVVPMSVTEEQIQSWRKILDESDAVLDGTKLLPHWRFAKGVNLRKVFEQPTTFDLVLWMTGQAAIPYLQDGPISTATTWNRMTGVFGNGWGSYLFWFN
jgi:hypothetical protein